MKMRTEHRGLSVVLVPLVLTFAAGYGAGRLPVRVIRLAYVNGAVSLVVAGSNNWVQAGINRPLMPGDRLWVDAGGRDEVQVGNLALRMDGGTLVCPEPRRLYGAVPADTGPRVSPGAPARPGGVEVDTPNLALSIRKPGVYRLPNRAVRFPGQQSIAMSMAPPASNYQRKCTPSSKSSRA